MRILHVSTLYPPELFSGGTLVPHRIARAQRERGHEVSVFTGSARMDEPPLAERAWELEGIPVRSVNVMGGYAPHAEQSYRNASVAEVLDRHVAALAPDVVHFHSIQALGADVLAVPHTHGAAAVLTMHDAWFACARQFAFTRPGPPGAPGAVEPRMCPVPVDPATCDCMPGFDFVARRRFLDAALEHVDRVVAVSTRFAEVLRASGIAPGKIVTCENGIPPIVSRPPLRRRGDTVRFGHLGGPDRWKGAGTIARALEHLGAGVVVRLHGVDADTWRAFGGRWPDRRVELAARYDPAQLGEVLADLDVVLVTSIGVESFSLVAREALQHGRPIVASRSVGPEEVVRDGENGLLHDRDDAEQLAAAMRRFADDPAFLARAAAAAAATPIRTVEAQVDELEDLYREVAPRRALRPAAVASPRLPGSVLFVAGMDGGPFRYRVANLVEQLEALGVRATARLHHDEEVLALAAEHEVVVLNRIPWDPYTRRIVERARLAGAVLVFGVDDLIFDPSLEIEALEALPREVARAYRRGLPLFRRTLLACDAFLGSTPALVEAARALGKPAFLHRNTLYPSLVERSDAARTRAARERAARADGAIRIGYFSGSHAHDRDFSAAAGAVARVMAARPAVRLVVGGHLRLPGAMAPLADRIERFPFVSWRELPGLIARTDVNLAPLHLPSAFNDAKSPLKWFEAAVAGVPTVASPSAPFREAIRHGATGFLARTEAEWEAALLALVDDPALRRRVADAGRAEALDLWGPARGTAELDRTFREVARLSRGPLRRTASSTRAEIAELRARGVGVGRPALEPRDAVPGPSELGASGVTPAIAGETSAQQTVSLPDGVLRRVDLLVATYGRVHRHDLVLRVVDLATGEELGRAAVPAEHACDNAWLAFDVGAIPTRAGRQVLLALEAIGGQRGEGVSVYCEPTGWPDGTGSCGDVRGIRLAFRTWMAEPAAAPASGGDGAVGAARADALRRRVELAEERIAWLASQPRGVEAALKRTRAWRRLSRAVDAGSVAGWSLPARSVRFALVLAGAARDPDDLDGAMDRVRATAAYRTGRRAYRALRREGLRPDRAVASLARDAAPRLDHPRAVTALAALGPARPVALATATALRHAGLERASARFAAVAGVVGAEVPVLLPGGLRRRRFVLASCDGRDLVARDLWFGGWSGFERPLPDLVAAISERVTGTFLDVGANTGFYGLLAATANPRLRIFCFEPFPPVFELLEQNLARNGSPASIRAVPLAAGATSGTAQLYVPLQDHGLVESSCSLDPSFKEAHSRVVTVPVTTLDAFVERERVEAVSLVKIDVEGHEHAVLAGADATVRRFRPIVAYELLGAGDRAAIERFRAEHRYASYRLREDGVVREARVDFDPRAWNHLMVPEERVPFFEEVVERTCGWGPPAVASARAFAPFEAVRGAS